ncbi:MAG: FecR domain-containing protein, partial [Opitutales bacterium]|nr:FecR domain-containing protein [Opitutales bacterium]
MLPPLIPNQLLCVFPRIICFLFFGSFVSGFELHADKVVSSVIIASVEGEVTSYNMIDDFKVTIGPKSVGRKMSSKSLISTGETGKIAILFSNGALFTIKPGSRFYLRKYKQLEGVVEGLPAPGKLEAEPTQSELSAHLDYGELVVKAPKLKKGSSMKVTSPLGTAGIRGTMFQFMAVRNSVTGDISGGINLISGDIDFTDTNGNPVTLVSGQSLQVGTNRLGETVASQSGELVNLSATYGNALTLGFVPPTLQMVFPNLVNDLGEPIDQDSPDQGDDFSTIPTVAATGFDFIQSIATEIFFEIESAEVSSAEFSFESMQLAVQVEAPIPQTESPTVPTVIAGDSVIADILRVVKGDHPNVQLLGDESMSIEMTDLPFSDFDPWITAEDFFGGSISGSANLLNPPDLKIPGTYQLVYRVSDIAGSTTSISRTVEVIATP